MSISEAHGARAVTRGTEKPRRMLVTSSSKEALTAQAGKSARAGLRQQNKWWESKELLSSHVLSTLCTEQGMGKIRNGWLKKRFYYKAYRQKGKIQIFRGNFVFCHIILSGLNVPFFCAHTGLIEIKAFKMKFLNIFNYSWGYQSWLLLGRAQLESKTHENL